MTDKEILQKAIQKACKNGYLVNSRFYWWRDDFSIENWERLDIIFSHDFAKAFWGTQGIGEESENGSIISYFDDFEYTTLGASYDWQAHLQVMILKEEPLKYLEKYLDETKN